MEFMLKLTLTDSNPAGSKSKYENQKVILQYRRQQKFMFKGFNITEKQEKLITRKWEMPMIDSIDRDGSIKIKMPWQIQK